MTVLIEFREANFVPGSVRYQKVDFSKKPRQFDVTLLYLWEFAVQIQGLVQFPVQFAGEIQTLQ